MNLLRPEGPMLRLGRDDLASTWTTTCQWRRTVSNGLNGTRTVRFQTLHYPDELDARLRKIRAAGRTAIEESGANMLYLAFGFLEWRDQQTSKPYQAPLLLMPVDLEREQVRSGQYRTLRPLDERRASDQSLPQKEAGRTEHRASRAGRRARSGKLSN